MNKKELIALTQDLASIMGSFLVFVIGNVVISVPWYLIISLMIGIPVTYLQILGVMLLASWSFKFIKIILG
jgi:F0F1-type ATP synthase assembly protein I